MPTFTNQATLRYNSGSVSSNIVTGEIITALGLTKTALNDGYNPGDIVNYAISLTNTGSTAINDLEITDDLGSYTLGTKTLVPLTYVPESLRFFVNGTAQFAPQVTNEDELIISGIDVPAGGNVMLLYSARVNAYAPMNADGSIVNTVSTSDNCPCEAGCDTAEITPACEPILTISKCLEPAVVTQCGEPVTYTFTIQNSGRCPALATDNVTVSDTFDPPISITSVEFNGTAWTGGNFYTYDAESGEFSTVAGQITVPAATYSQNLSTGEWSAVPGESVLKVTGVFCQS